MLTRVTITGADDAVDVARLVELTREFPFVEWGLLRSTKHGSDDVKRYNMPGPPRYPSMGWRERLASTLCDGPPIRNQPSPNLSAHLCGEVSRRMMAGEENVFYEDAVNYGRFQLNGASRYRLPALLAARRRPQCEFILQASDLTTLHEHTAFIDREGYENVSVLYDPSGGRGRTTVSWPLFSRCGYAGGITPDNVAAILRELTGAAPHPFWIDMESGVRTDDRFDLDKARKVLELSQPFVQAEPLRATATPSAVAIVREWVERDQKDRM